MTRLAYYNPTSGQFGSVTCHSINVAQMSQAVRDSGNTILKVTHNTKLR